MTLPSTTTIVQISSMDLGGGAERIASDIHRSCLKRGLSSHLAVGQRFDASGDALLIPNDERRSPWAKALLGLQPPLPGPHSAPSASARVARIALKVLAEPVRSWRRARGFEDFNYPGTAMIPNIAGAQADVVNLHNLHGGYFDLRCLPQISSIVPTVLTAHDTWVTSGHCAYSLDCERWKTGCGECPYLFTPPAVPRDETARNWRLKQDIYRRSSVHLVGPSRWVLKQIENSMFADAIASSTLIPNGVDQTVFHPASRSEARAELGLPEEPLILLFSVASESNPYKDFATIRNALPGIVERAGDREILLVALGRYPSDLPDPGARILSIPYLSEPAQVARYLQAADICIHMAHAENHPLAILEAQSCGIPVIASDVGGIPEALLPDTTGLLVHHADPRSLADAAATLLLDDERRSAMGTAAAQSAAQRFGLDRMVDDYLGLYETIAIPSSSRVRG